MFDDPICDQCIPSCYGCGRDAVYRDLSSSGGRDCYCEGCAEERVHGEDREELEYEPMPVKDLT
jgi:hypothetical protein